MYFDNNNPAALRSNQTSSDILDSNSHKKIYGKKRVKKIKQQIRKYLISAGYQYKIKEHYYSHFIKANTYFNTSPTTIVKICIQ